MLMCWCANVLMGVPFNKSGAAIWFDDLVVLVLSLPKGGGLVMGLLFNKKDSASELKVESLK